MTLLAQFAATGGGVANYIEDVFSTYLYVGNDTSQTITNNIDLSTKGGMVWIKARSGTYSTGPNVVNDTVRGAQKALFTNTAGAPFNSADLLSAFTSTGFSVGSSTDTNGGTTNMASWTFREQSKFFDVVTWTGTGANRTIAHALGSVPGCIMVKRTDTSGDWQVYHRSLANTEYLVLNSTAAVATGATRWNSTTATSTEFSLGTDATVNASAGTYVAYLWAHDAGGFGLTSSDNVVSCGSYTGTGAAGNPVTLGYEPQWLLIKRATGDVGNWNLFDNMRGFCNASSAATSLLLANTTGAESTGNSVGPTATGFEFGSGAFNNSGATFIYIAIRRGPMKVPTTGTSVFTPAIRTGDGATSVNVTNATFPVDLVIGRGRSTSAPTPTWIDRLRGATVQLRSDNADAEAASTIMSSLASQTGWIGSTGGSGSWNISSVNYIQWYMRRAPSFFDEVCYTGTGVARTVAHNLTVAPQLIIAKGRTLGNSWAVSDPSTGNGFVNYLSLNSTAASGAFSGMWNDTAPTSTVFSLGDSGGVNANTYNYVAYLFATCAGVSKVGSYTGTGTTQTINCGFTAGSRFVMIKRTDSTGDWYVWDSARGIIAGNDPYLLLNTADAEVTSTDYVDTAATGFELSSTAPAAINANGGSFIFLAIA